LSSSTRLHTQNPKYIHTKTKERKKNKTKRRIKRPEKCPQKTQDFLKKRKKNKEIVKTLNQGTQDIN
jgi:hypothetical protein